jgi:hypothetical protein
VRRQIGEGANGARSLGEGASGQGRFYTIDRSKTERGFTLYMVTIIEIYSVKPRRGPPATHAAPWGRLWLRFKATRG